MQSKNVIFFCFIAFFSWYKPYSLTKPLLLWHHSIFNVVSLRSMWAFISYDISIHNVRYKHSHRSIWTFMSFGVRWQKWRFRITEVAVWGHKGDELAVVFMQRKYIFFISDWEWDKFLSHKKKRLRIRNKQNVASCCDLHNHPTKELFRLQRYDI